MMRTIWRPVLALLLILAFCAASAACSPKEESSGGKSGELFAGVKDNPKETAQPTPEPTPVPIPVQFQAGLETVLNNSVAKSESMSGAGLGFLFDPSGIDTSKSSRVETLISVQQKGEDEQKMKTVSLMDAGSGDAAFTIAAVAGSETKGEGGMYFAGDAMLLRRADASKPIIRFVPNAALTASYKEQSALSRAGLALSKEQKPVQSKDEWAQRITSFAALVLSQSADADYAEGTADLTLPGGSGSAQTIEFSLSGEKARAVLTDYVTMLSENGGISNMVNSLETADQKDTNVTRLDALKQAIQSGEAQMKAVLLSYEDQPVGVDMSFTVDGSENAWRLLFYEKGFERRNEISFQFGDGALMSLTDTNASAGGDSYTGEMSAEMVNFNGENVKITFASQSTNTDALYDMTGTISFTQTTKEDGSKTVPITVAWKQQKNASGGVDATGSMQATDPEENTTTDTAITYGKTYEDIAIEVPQFIEGSGISAATREEVLKELDMDVEQFDSLPAPYRGLMLLMALSQ